MLFDEVECVIGELIGYLVPLHGWNACTIAGPENEEEKGESYEKEGSWKKGKIKKTLH